MSAPETPDLIRMRNTPRTAGGNPFASERPVGWLVPFEQSQDIGAARKNAPGPESAVERLVEALLDAQESAVTWKARYEALRGGIGLPTHLSDAEAIQIARAVLEAAAPGYFAGSGALDAFTPTRQEVGK